MEVSGPSVEHASKQDYVNRRNESMITQEPILPNLALHLIHAGLLDKQTAYEAAYHAKNHKIPFITYLVQKTILVSQDILQTCQHIFSLPVFDLNDYNDSSIELLSIELIRQYRIIPLWKKNNILHIGISDPTDQEAIEAVAFHTQLSIKLFLIDENQLSQFIQSFYDDHKENKYLQQNLLRQIALDEKHYPIQDKIIFDDEPLIKFVDNMILHAFQQNASDIHIESYENICRIRHRQHGILFLVNEIPQQLAVRIVTRLKVMAKLNIAEKRLPQDGRFQLNHIDIRMNTCPTHFGEKVVLRLLNSNLISLDIHQLGLLEDQQALFINAISRPQGMILVTGPTGSGKTVTLYSALNYLNQSEKNISTVEDPIEIRLHGINQVNINTKIGLDFSTVLRAFLRQDPDIIMIGEIRDLETAEIAVQASQTGHLVLSTLHTNSAIETITRLRAIGIPSYNLAESISLIIAQRLIRQLCDFCKMREQLNDYTPVSIKNTLTPEYIYRAKGCAQCTQGYKNRIALYECLPITEKMSRSILSETDSQTLLADAKQDKFITLKESAMKYVSQGKTSFSEISRVLQT